MSPLAGGQEAGNVRRVNGSDFDVIILGTGIAGTTMGAVLARHGLRTLLLDAGVHPKFAIGESTIPQTSQMVQLLARDFDVPELEILGLRSPGALRSQVTTSCGIKRIFGFAYHRVGEEHRPAEAHQFGNVWRDENHLFRQDVDSWMMNVAVSYGADLLQGTAVTDVQVDEDGAVVDTADGARYTARFVVDGSGTRSILAQRYGLWDEPSRLQTNTRSMFTHMIGVREFEDSVQSHMGHRWNQGTLHHIFERGWFWVIPFNNWEGATNPLVSVGVTVDNDRWPFDPEVSPADEFEQFLDMVPSARAQFADAYAVRPWLRGPRLQHSSHRTIGPRFALLSHAAGFVDPLFSRGLISTMDNIRDLAGALLAAFADDDFSEDRFEMVDRKQIAALDYADKIVSASYISWDDFELWNRWVRFWAIGVHATESNLGSVLAMGKYSKFTPAENPIASAFEPAGFRAFFQAGYDALLAYDRGERTVAETVAVLQHHLDVCDIAIPLRDGCQGQEWAMSNPLCRDVFLGDSLNHARWQRGEVDPHLEPGATDSELLVG